MAGAIHTVYSYRINDFSTASGWSTASIFDAGYLEANVSPIDTYYQKLKELNILTLDPRSFKSIWTGLHSRRRLSATALRTLDAAFVDTASVPPVLANLVLLGYISAVESYFREIIRRVITIDANSRKACELKTIAFGAAIFHKPDMLPEALLEHITFLSKENIKTVIKDFMGIKNFPISQSVEDGLQEYEDVCQLRHCIVHRFGKLGANNAIKLGLDSHSGFIEKPIKLDYAALQKVGVVCSNLVKEVNQYLWQYIMTRLIGDNNQAAWKKKAGSIPWSWDYRRDKKNFKVYFDIFALTSSTAHAVNMKSAYDDYKAKYHSLP